MTDLVEMRAVDHAAMLRRREISARELLNAHLERIEAINPELNAIVTLVPDIAKQMASDADEALARGGVVPLLTGLPVSHKDLHETAGIRTTFGSPAYEHFVPKRNTLIVDRMQKAGAVTIGKTNTPQHGAGSQTFNEVFGVTRNPWNTDLTPGGSSGGAGVAVATGMSSLADGSDFGASLRNPASFTNTVGFRPSPGRIQAGRPRTLGGHVQYTDRWQGPSRTLRYSWQPRRVPILGSPSRSRRKVHCSLFRLPLTGGAFRSLGRTTSADCQSIRSSPRHFNQ